MICYIKDRMSFSIKCYGQATGEYIPHSINNDVSTLTISTKGRHNAPAIQAGDFVFADDYMGLLTESTPEQKWGVKLTCERMEQLFDREVFVDDDTPENGVEPFLQRQIEKHFVQVPDAMYGMPYISVHAMTTTLLNIKPDTDGTFWNVTNYIDKIRAAANIFVEFIAKNNTLHVNILRRDVGSHNVDLNTSLFELLEESYTIDQVGRITCFAQDTQAYHDWYLLQDGSIADAYTLVNRVRGRWLNMVVDAEEDAAMEVAAVFRKNMYSHLIQFASRYEFDYCDALRIITRNGKVFHSYISTIHKQTGSSRIVYTAGELRLLLDEKLNKALSNKGG